MRLSKAAAIAPAFEFSRRAWIRVSAALAVALVCLAMLFLSEIHAAVGVWSHSTAYNHCFLILPIVAYLLWGRREVFGAIKPAPTLWITIFAMPLGLVWLIAKCVGLMEVRQLVALSLAQVLFLAGLGAAAWRRLSFPLIYLYFLVPVGEFLIPTLQNLTASFVVHGLNLMGVPNFADGVTIQIAEGKFYIAEACAGLRFLVASVAFGALYADLMFRDALRRAVFFGASIIIPIIANGVRAFGIVYLAHLLGSAEAVEADHLIYGWVFFSLVSLFLILVGLPFRQSPKLEDHLKAGAVAPGSSNAAVVVSVIVAISAIAWVSAAFIDAELTRRSAFVRSQFPEISRCELPRPRVATGETAFAEGGDRHVSAEYQCGQDLFTLEVRAFSFATPMPVVFHSQLLLTPSEGPHVTRSSQLQVAAGTYDQTWRLTEWDSDQVYSAVASAVWIDGLPAPDRIFSRFREAWSGLMGSSFVPFVLAVRLEGGNGWDIAERRRAMSRFLTAATSGPLGQLAIIEPPQGPN